MAGIYIHIPFCKKACHYCNFHFSTSMVSKSKMVEAIAMEIERRAKDYNQEPIESIYFGGGTPSLLEADELDLIFNTIEKHFKISNSAEITLEANPDDLDKDYLKILDESPVNRLSIGVQSFFDQDLKWMNRAHNSEEALQSILDAQEMGFDNISIDLIFGSPTTTDLIWEKNLRKAIELNIPHLSCYALTVEPDTALQKMIALKKKKDVNDAQQSKQFMMLMEYAETRGYEQYEISNFAKPGKEAVHNSNYWKAKKYLGVGPSAHSFDGKDRYFNVNHNVKYMEAIANDQLPITLDERENKDVYNEYVLTRLRTIWGCDLSEIETLGAKYRTHFEKEVKDFLRDKKVLVSEGKYTLSKMGKLFADQISSELFYI